VQRVGVAGRGARKEAELRTRNSCSIYSQIHGDRESPETSDGQEDDPLHSSGHLGRGRGPVPADAALFHDVHAELHQRRGEGHLLRELAGSGQQRPELRRIFVSTVALMLAPTCRGLGYFIFTANVRVARDSFTPTLTR
jgi:hypothetical protein